MAHKSTNLDSPKVATRTPRTPAPAPVQVIPTGASAPVGDGHPVLSVRWSRKGRPDTDRADLLADVFAYIAQAVQAAPAPKLLKVPANLPARVRRAIEAENARAAMIRSAAIEAVASGRNILKAN